MKKLRMIVTSVVVLAIVGSAFAFKAKIGRYCITTATDNNCTTFTAANLKITTALSGTPYKYYPCWDANDMTACTAANNHLCTATFRLTSD